jgi:Lon protease-like protein
MSRRIPLFPLPGVVLLPGTLLPLHIFEPRYRAMVAHALEGERTIGMAMMKPGWESSPEAPEIHPIGGAGEIVESEPLDDGRYNIVLEGRFRFKVIAEAPGNSNPYRVGVVEEIASIPFAEPGAQDRSVSAAVGLFADVQRHLSLPPLPTEPMTAERLASEIALRLRFAPAELQALLETDSLAGRFERLIARMADWSGRIRFFAPFRPREIDPRRN